MKLRKAKWLLIFAIFNTLLLTGCARTKTNDNFSRIKSKQELVWGVRPDTRLFGQINIKNSQLEGFEIDLAKLLTKQVLGKKGRAVLRPISEKTRITLLNNGSLDAVISTMTITDERKKVISFSDPYFYAGETMLVKKGSPYQQVTDLNKAGVRVIAMKGTSIPDVVHHFAPKAKMMLFDDYGQAFNALKAGQGDVMIDDNGILAGLIADDPNYTLAGGTFTSEPYGIGLQKGQTSLRKAINHALQRIKANGQYERLLKKWFAKIPGLSISDLQTAQKNRD